MDSTSTDMGVKGQIPAISNTGTLYPHPPIASGNVDIKKDRARFDVLARGFDLCVVAGTFIAAVQSSILNLTLNTSANQETVAIRAINVFFLGGLILDIMAAVLSFLTSRWFQRLSEQEKDLLEKQLADVNRGRQGRSSFYVAWLSLSLFIPMPMLIIGVMCMLLGLYTYVWTQHPTVVAAIVTLGGGATLPFLLGVLLIGQNTERRESIIKRLGTMQGDW